MADWREAASLLTLLRQVNSHWPTRSKDSDGTVGDQSHAARNSDHNPVGGVVHALDITHDPAHGFNSYAFADEILRQQDPRLSYVISNRRIGSGPRGPQPGVWRKYTGSNPHDHHCHISVVGSIAADDTAPWKFDGYPADIVASGKFITAPITVRIGLKGDIVKKMQSILGCAATGEYWPGSETEFALKLFQVRHGLLADGVCGPQTWKLLDPIIGVT
jgi:peptidoglycan hydrolase-like protein with peptidoglycan-binding domain